MYPKHLPTNIRLHFASESYGKGKIRFPLKCFHRYKVARDDSGSRDGKPVPPQVMLLAKGDIREGCRIAGLSRAAAVCLFEKAQHLIKEMKRPGGTALPVLFTSIRILSGNLGFILAAPD
jgi:hypothetical protein